VCRNRGSPLCQWQKQKQIQIEIQKQEGDGADGDAKGKPETASALVGCSSGSGCVKIIINRKYIELTG